MVASEHEEVLRVLGDNIINVIANLSISLFVCLSDQQKILAQLFQFHLRTSMLLNKQVTKPKHRVRLAGLLSQECCNEER